MKTYFDDQLSYFLQSTNGKMVKLYAKKNKATLNDDYLGISSAIKKGILQCWSCSEWFFSLFHILFKNNDHAG